MFQIAVIHRQEMSGICFILKTELMIGNNGMLIGSNGNSITIFKSGQYQTYYLFTNCSAYEILKFQCKGYGLHIICRLHDINQLSGVLVLCW